MAGDPASDVAEIAESVLHTLHVSQGEIANRRDSALTLEEIPIKLRCAGCNKIAINAFRMPCCDQSLCETCMLTWDTLL